MPIQIGFPELPPSESDAFFYILKLWLEDCDTNHDCRGVFTGIMPTRLVDVGTAGHPTLRLIESHAEVASSKYIAISHTLGDGRVLPFFTTTSENVKAFRYAIPEHQLPMTLAD